MCKYVVVRWKKRRSGQLEQRWNWRLEGGEESPVVSGQPCQLGPW